MHNYLITGNDLYWRKNELNKIIRTLNQNEDYEILNVNFESESLSNIINHLTMGSLFRQKSIIIAHQALFLGNHKITDAKKNNYQDLVDYLKNPNPDHVLILIYPHAEVSKKKQLAKDILSYVNHHKTPEYKGIDLVNNIIKYASHLGANIDDAAAELLVNYLPNDFGVITNEIKKLHHIQNHIDEKIVRDNVQSHLKLTIFDLTNAFLTKDKHKFLTIYHDMLFHNYDPIHALYLFAYNLALIRQIKVLWQQGKKISLISKQLDIHGYRVQRLLNYQRLWKYEEINYQLQMMAAFDKKFKTSKIYDKISVEFNMLQLLL